MGRHEGGARQEAWVVLAWRRRHRQGLYSLSLLDPSTEHEREPGHSHMADRCTAPGRRTRGYSCFTRHTLIFTHLN